MLFIIFDHVLRNTFLKCILAGNFSEGRNLWKVVGPAATVLYEGYILLLSIVFDVSCICHAYCPSRCRIHLTQTRSCGFITIYGC